MSLNNSYYEKRIKYREKAVYYENHLRDNYHMESPLKQLE